MARCRLVNHAVLIEIERLGCENRAMIGVGYHQHFMPLENILNRKLKVWLTFKGRFPISSQRLAPTQLAFARKGYRLLGSKNDVFSIVFHDPVKIVAVPAMLPRLRK